MNLSILMQLHILSLIMNFMILRLVTSVIIRVELGFVVELEISYRKTNHRVNYTFIMVRRHSLSLTELSYF